MHSMTRLLARSAATLRPASALPRHYHPALPALALGSITIRSISISTSTSTSTTTTLTSAHVHTHQPPPLYNLAPTDLTSLLFDSIHALPLSLSWPAAIALTALVLRTSLTLPLAWHAHATANRMHALRPLARAWSHSTAMQLRSQAHAHGWAFDKFQQEYKRQYAERLGKMYYENGIRPLFAILAPVAQIPVWIAASLGLRQLCDPSLDKAGELARIGLDNVPVELANSAFLWAPSLVVPDPTWIGPVVLAGVHLANVQIAMRSRVGGAEQQAPPGPVSPSAQDEAAAASVVDRVKAWDRQTVILWGMRGVAVAMVPVAKTVPFALVVYWLTSAGFSLVQNIVFKVILARPAEPLPPPPTQDADTIIKGGH